MVIDLRIGSWFENLKKDIDLNIECRFKNVKKEHKSDVQMSDIDLSLIYIHIKMKKKSVQTGYCKQLVSFVFVPVILYLDPKGYSKSV